MKTEFIITFHASANKAGTLAQKMWCEHEAWWQQIQNKNVPTSKKAETYRSSGFMAGCVSVSMAAGWECCGQDGEVGFVLVIFLCVDV
ncbi:MULTISPECIES: hypothetical protein [unclassified Pseudomonas]|jgi:hypothetical protein|uniref:hypothetical protein n=1 Tax=unclassified Pseudomonas TaxID=196821 RepID=UPI001CFA1CAC|nr:MULTISPECIES: hypothetical protein [unclassified Pseudomonas]WLH80983.1 hypothetical protein PSH81_08420 [Pseudomonas sp. FP2335]